jgi:Ca-activated chloride channel homolog
MMNWWNNVVFAEQWVLWFLFILPLVAAGIFFFSEKGKPVLTLSSFRYLAGAKTPARVKWRIILPILRLACLAVLIMAFARPQSRGEWKREHGKGIDIVICLDVSPSMEAGDFYPTRLERAKLEAANFVDKRPDDRIGIVVFGGESFTLCPLTYDHRTLKTLLMTVSTNILDAGGTAIGMGLAKSVERLKESKAKSKVVVLLTDGENNQGMIQPYDAARLAATYKIKTYTIGMGATEGKVLTPTARNPDGSYVQQYQPVTVADSSLLEMAQITGGKYFRANDGAKLEEIYKEIDKLEKTEFDKKGKQEHKEEYLPFLFLAVFLLGLEFVLRYTVFDTLT